MAQQHFPPRDEKWQKPLQLGGRRPRGQFEAGVLVHLFDFPKGAAHWDISADGQKFLAVLPNVEEDVAQPFTVVVNWLSELKKQVGSTYAAGVAEL